MNKTNEKALGLIIQYGDIDGAHHKQWLLDQIARVLAGDSYEEWVAAYCASPDPDEVYEWDTGIAP